MKKYLLTFILLPFSIIVIAQNANSAAYNAGYMIGQALGYGLVAFLIGWGIWRLTRNKKK